MRPRITLDIHREGRRVAAFLLFIPCLLGTGLLTQGTAQSPEVVVTEIFVDSRSDVAPAFLADGGREAVAASSARLVELLEAQEGWRVHADFLANPAATVGSLAGAGERVYVRGVVTRADIRQTRLFAGLELWTFSVGVRLECFDIRSGQVWFGQEATVRLPVESVGAPAAGDQRRFFAEAYQAALEHAARRTGSGYRPGSLDAVLTGATEDSLVVLDRGSRHGLVAGVGAQLEAGGQQWLLRVQEVQPLYSLAKVVAATTPSGPPLGSVLRFPGVNSLMALDGPPMAVAGAALPDAGLDPAFDVDATTLGQWLHDALVDSRVFNMLPPLLSGSDGGSSELAAAFFRSQAAFSAVGDVRQGEVIGNRSLPQVLVRLSLTHADLARSTRLGYEAQDLRLGLLLEVYDRRTHEVLLSCTHEGSRTEKQHQQYRQVDLVNAWRELAQATIREVATKAAGQWKPQLQENVVASVGPDGAIQVEQSLQSGQRGELLRPGEAIEDRTGATLVRRLRPYAVAQSLGERSLAVLATDGGTTPRKGDVLRLADRPGRPNARIRTVSVGGEKVEATWHPSSMRVVLWAQDALGASGRYNMLAPAELEAQVAAAEVALAGGEFRLGNLQEVLLADPPQPQVLVDVRVGLGRWERKATQYKADLSFITGVELSFYTAQGDPMPLFTDRNGQPSHQVKKAWTEVEEQVIANGQVVQGVVEADFPQRLDACLRSCMQQLGADLAAQKASK